MPNQGSYPDFYPNVSGNVVELKDGIGNRRTNNLSGRKVLILGTATDGPVLENVNMSSLDSVEDLFGKFYDKERNIKNGATLVQGFKRVQSAGADNIDLMRISGKESTAQIPMDATIEEVIHDDKVYTVAEGNSRTIVDLEIPSTRNELRGYDNARIDNVEVTATERSLSTNEFKVEENNGRVIIFEDVANSDDEVTIEYELILEKFVNVPEPTEKVNSGITIDTSDTEYLDGSYGIKLPDIYGVPENYVTENPEEPLYEEVDREEPEEEFIRVVYVTDGVEENATGDIDWAETDLASGIVVFNTPTATKDTIRVSYVYRAASTLSGEELDSISTNEYRLPNQNIIPQTETIIMDLIGGSTVVLKSQEYNLNYDSGILTIYDLSDYEGINGLTYEYKKRRSEEMLHREYLNTKEQRIELQHTADSRKPVVVNGSQSGDLSEDKYRISWAEQDNSIVWLKPGAAVLGENLTISYYWAEDKIVQPVVQSKSVFAGSKYNQVKIELKDNIAELTNEYYKIVKGTETGESLISHTETFTAEDEANYYVFPHLGESQSVFADSVYIEDGDGKQLLGIDDKGNRIGAYLNDDEFERTDDDILDESVWEYRLYPDSGKIAINADATEVNGTPVANYAYKVQEKSRVTTHRGTFDPKYSFVENEDEEDTKLLGGGYYKEESLDLSNNRTDAHFPTNDLLPDYYNKSENQSKIIFNRNIYDEANSINYHSVKITMKDYINGEVSFYPKSDEELPSTGNVVEFTDYDKFIDLPDKDIVFESERIISPTGVDDFKEGVDYEMDYDNGKIKAFADGSLSTNKIYTVEYNYEIVDVSDVEVTVSIEKDFDIDYSSGVIEFKRPLAINEDIKIKDVQSYNVISKKMIIHKPNDKYLDSESGPLVIDNIGTDIHNMAQLINTVNSHSKNNNIVYLSIENEHINKPALSIKTPIRKLTNWDQGDVRSKVISFMGGKDEIDLTNEELYEKLEGKDNALGAYDVVIDLEDVDILLPMGVYVDSKLLSNYKKFDQQLADFLSRAFLRDNEIQGVIGTKPITEPTMVNVIKSINEKENLNTDYYMTDESDNYIRDKEGNRIDIGRFLSIIGYDILYEDFGIAIPSIESGAADFAGVASMLGSNVAPTNERIGSGELAYNISINQASRLIRNKIVPAKIKSGSPKILDAVTAAQPNSGWTRWFTVDIVFDVINDLREVFDTYIGRANNIQNRSSLNSDVRKVLTGKSTLVDSDFNLVIDPSDPEMGTIITELDLTPSSELQRIHTVVSLNQEAI